MSKIGGFFSCYFVAVSVIICIALMRKQVINFLMEIGDKI